MYRLLVLDSACIAFSALALLFDETVGRISRDSTVFSLVDLLVPPAAGLANSAARSAARFVCARVFFDGAALSATS